MPVLMQSWVLEKQEKSDENKERSKNIQEQIYEKQSLAKVFCVGYTSYTFSFCPMSWMKLAACCL